MLRLRHRIASRSSGSAQHDRTKVLVALPIRTTGILAPARASGISTRRPGQGVKVGLSGQLGTAYAKTVEARRHPRYQLETEICIYPRNAEVVRGHTVDLSESGISAMLRVEVPLGEVVRLEFKLPQGEVDVHAMVRQRNAFRYGFQFVESESANEVIGRTCRQLALEQSLANDVL